MYITYMYLDYRSVDGGDGVGYRERCVRIGAGIQYYCVTSRKSLLMELVYYGSLVIALEILDIGIAILSAQFCEIVFKIAAPVYVGFAPAQQVQVGAVYNHDFGCHSVSLIVNKVQSYENPLFYLRNMADYR